MVSMRGASPFQLVRIMQLRRSCWARCQSRSPRRFRFLAKRLERLGGENGESFKKSLSRSSAIVQVGFSFQNRKPSRVLFLVKSLCKKSVISALRSAQSCSVQVNLNKFQPVQWNIVKNFHF